VLDGKHVALRIRVYCGKNLQPAGVLLQRNPEKEVLQQASADPLPFPWAPRGSVANFFKPFWPFIIVLLGFSESLGVPVD